MIGCPLRVALIGLMLASAALADDDGPDPPGPPHAIPNPADAGDDAAVEPEGDDEADADDPPKRRPGPIVRSSELSESTSKFLRRPGDTPYAPSVDWARVPAWEQTSFFGVRVRGKFFVFVVDCSGSMADDLRLVRAKQELRRTIGAMRFPQRYLIIFYNDRPRPMSGGMPRSADQRGKAATDSWLRAIDAEGGTDPKGAMDLALGYKPDAVFLLSDGEFPPGTDGALSIRNAERTPVHCIDLDGGPGASQLRAIAEDSGGSYAVRR